MGRTSKPIYIVVEDAVFDGPEFADLAGQGHTVLRFSDPAVEWDKAEVICGPRMWRWLPGISEKWLPQLLKEVRAAQPPRPKKGKKNGTAAS